jgi:malate synthase
MTTLSTKAKASRSPLPSGVKVLGEITPAFSEILTPEALAFVAKLQRQFGTRRKQCLEHRQERQRRLDQGEGLDFSPETKQIREGDWKCAAISIHRRAPKPLSLLANQLPQCLLIRR